MDNLEDEYYFNMNPDDYEWGDDSFYDDGEDDSNHDDWGDEYDDHFDPDRDWEEHYDPDWDSY